MSFGLSAVSPDNPDLARAECWYLDPKAAGALLCRRLSGRPSMPHRRRNGCCGYRRHNCETAEYHFYGALSRAASCHSVAADQSAPASGGPGRPPSTAPALGGELPGEFREPRRAGRRRDRPPRGPRARCRASLRTGHPLGPRERLCPQRGARQRARRALLRGAWLRDEIARLICGMPATATCAGAPTARCGNSISCIRSSEEAEPVSRPTGTIGAPVEHLDLATVIKVSQAVSSEIVLEKLLDTLMHTAIEQAGAERGLLLIPRGTEQRIAAEATTPGDTVRCSCGTSR